MAILALAGCSQAAPQPPTPATLHGSLRHLEWVAPLVDSLQCEPDDPDDPVEAHFKVGRSPYYWCSVSIPGDSLPPPESPGQLKDGNLSLVVDRTGLVLYAAWHWPNMGFSKDSVDEAQFTSFRRRMRPPRQCWAFDNQALVWDEGEWAVSAVFYIPARPVYIRAAIGDWGRQLVENLDCDAGLGQ